MKPFIGTNEFCTVVHHEKSRYYRYLTVKPGEVDSALGSFDSGKSCYDAEQLLSYILEYMIFLCLKSYFDTNEMIPNIIEQNRDKYQLFCSVFFLFLWDLGS